MCAKRGTPETFVFVGDADGLDDGLIGDTVAAGVVVLLDGVAGADDTRVDDPAANGAGDDASADDAAGDDMAAGSWLPSAEAAELRGCELVHPNITRATAAVTDQRATLALPITSHSRSEGRSARCRSSAHSSTPRVTDIWSLHRRYSRKMRTITTLAAGFPGRWCREHRHVRLYHGVHAR